MKLKEAYNEFFSSGELFEIMPTATGEWDVDKNEFELVNKELSDAMSIPLFDEDEEDINMEL